MTTLALQIFLLLLAAFLIGCMIGCLLRRTFYDPGYTEAERELAATAGRPTPSEAVIVKPIEPAAERFGRALTSAPALATGTAAAAAANANQSSSVDVRKVEPAQAATPSPAADTPRPAPAQPVTPTVMPAAKVDAAPVARVEPQAPAAPTPARPATVQPAAPAPSDVPPAPVQPVVAPAPAAPVVRVEPQVPAAPAPARPATVQPVAPPAPVVRVTPQAPSAPAPPATTQPVIPAATPAPIVKAAEPPVTKAPMPARPADVQPAAPHVRAETQPQPATSSSVSETAAAIAAAAAAAAAVNPTAGNPPAPVRVSAPEGQASPVAAPKTPEGTSPLAAAVAAASAAGAMAAAAAAGAAPRTVEAAPPAQPADDLQRIRAIDAAMHARLKAAGITRFSQIAAWTSEDVIRLNQVLGFTGRIEQENWIEQAQILSRGGETDYARRRRLGALAAGTQTEANGAPGVDTSSASATAAGTVGIATAAAAAIASQVARQSAGPDRLMRIIGVDADAEKALIGMGYTRYSDIARWTPADIEKVERQLNRPGRVGLDNWVEQARVLARYAGEGETGAVRPLKLTDAIRETKDAAAAAPAPVSAPAAVAAATVAAATTATTISAPPAEKVEPADPAKAVAPVEAVTPAAAPPPAERPAPAPVARPDLSGLRSVRSEALRGEVPLAGERFDDLKRIRGIGVLIEKRLNSLGIHSYEQIANWSGADIDRISHTLDFKGRIERENWIEQARILASGGQTEFSRRVDRGEVDSSKDS